MTSSSKLTALVVVVLAASCDPPDIVPPPIPFPPPAQLRVLVEQSPCDILPDSGTIGTQAHARGYPRWNGEEIVTDSTAPAQTPDPAVVRALTEGYSFENEVHDCQRLVVSENRQLRFGPLIGLLPLDGAMELSDSGLARGQALATVYNWGGLQDEPEAYGSLSIEDGWNCLWLRNTSSGWRASVTAQPSGSSRACFDLAPPASDSAYTLDVLRVFHGDSIPKTARWDWDETMSTHLMGIKCGSAWCLIGPPDSWPTDSVQLTGVSASTAPGYIDEQHLPVSDGDGGMKPGPIGRVTPTADFHQLASQQHGSDLDVLGPRFSGGLMVAHIDIPALPPGTATPAPYDSVWGTRQRPVTLRLRTSINIAGSTVKNDTSTFFENGNETRRVSPVRLSGTAHAAVGAVRWRWHDTANTVSIWSACGEKGLDCCDTQ